MATVKGRFKKSQASKHIARLKRHLRIRSKMLGKPERPRLVVFRSEKHLYAQVIDDTAQKVLFQASTLDKNLDIKKGYTLKAAAFVGEALAKKALTHKVNKIVFDVSGYKYHGRVKALADAARRGGLQF